MSQILFTIIPLDFAATLSPGILALTLVLLGSKKHSLSSTLSLLFGNLITSSIIIFAAFFLTSVSISSKGPNITSAVIDLVLGLFFVFYGLKVFFSKEGKLKFKNKNSTSGVLKWVIIGFIISITNLDAVLLSFTATREVATSSVAFVEKIFFTGLNVFFFVLPITLPLGICFIFPKIGDVFLTKLNKYVIKYSKYIICIMFLVFGIYFVFRALKHF